MATGGLSSTEGGSFYSSDSMESKLKIIDAPFFLRHAFNMFNGFKLIHSIGEIINHSHHIKLFMGVRNNPDYKLHKDITGVVLNFLKELELENPRFMKNEELIEKIKDRQ